MDAIRPLRDTIAAITIAAAVATFPAGAHARAATTELTLGAVTPTTYAPSIHVLQRHGRPGATLLFIVEPGSATRCRIRFTGPRGMRGPRRTIAGSGVVDLRLRLSRDATPGRWTLGLRCEQREGAPLAAAQRFGVSGHGRGGLGRLALRKRVPVLGSPRFDSRQCTSWAYEKRPDIYHLAVGAGVPWNGRFDAATFAGDVVWNAKHWAANARAAGIPTGPRPIVGALYVRITGTFGHVAYVEQVYEDGSYEVSERNGDASGRSTEVRRRVRVAGEPGVEFVYGGPVAGPWEGGPEPA